MSSDKGHSFQCTLLHQNPKVTQDVSGGHDLRRTPVSWDSLLYRWWLADVASEEMYVIHRCPQTSIHEPVSYFHVSCICNTTLQFMDMWVLIYMFREFYTWNTLKPVCLYCAYKSKVKSYLGKGHSYQIGPLVFVKFNGFEYHAVWPMSLDPCI